MSTEEKDQVTVQDETQEKKVEKIDSDDDVDGLDGNKKATRGEKKFKKAMGKLGLKPVSGINRVTIKKGRQLLLCIDEPEVMKAPNSDNQYLVFGEVKISDFAQQMAQTEANQFKKPEQAQKVEQSKGETVVEKKEEAEADELNEDGLEADAILQVMEHCKVSKVEAIKALRANGGERVNAILQLSGQ